MNIPIIIQIEQKKEAELDRDLFGKGEKVTDPSLTKFAEGDVYYMKTSGTIVEGITVTHQTGREIKKAMESVQANFIDAHFIISITDFALGLALNSFTIADWFLNRTKNQNCRIIIDGKEVKTTPEFQQKLIEFIKTNSNQ